MKYHIKFNIVQIETGFKTTLMTTKHISVYILVRMTNHLDLPAIILLLTVISCVLKTSKSWLNQDSWLFWFQWINIPLYLRFHPIQYNFSTHFPPPFLFLPCFLDQHLSLAKQSPELHSTCCSITLGCCVFILMLPFPRMPPLSHGVSLLLLPYLSKLNLKINFFN